MALGGGCADIACRGETGWGMTSPYHRPLRVGTRGSPLALAQARQVTSQLRERCGRAAVLIAMATPGDGSAAPIEQLGTTGVFTTTLRAALLRGEVDLVVHSAKDLPAAPVPGLQVAAFPARADPRDALIWPGGTSLAALPRGARIGTGSPRRAALLRATGHPLQIVPMRGNVGTRLRKLANGEADALVLAMAGLSRLGLPGAIATPLYPSVLMPAPAQGVLALECRADDLVTAAELRTLDHAPTRAAAITERGFLAGLGAGCSTPAGALAEVTTEAGAEPEVCLSGVIAAADGSVVIRARMTGLPGSQLGRRLAQVLLQQGGAALLAIPRGMGPASGTAGTAATVQGQRALAPMPDHRPAGDAGESRTGPLTGNATDGKRPGETRPHG
jgi:hydroxymethylbilane synthase